MIFDDKMEELLLELFHSALVFVLAFNEVGYLSSLHPRKTQQKYKVFTEALIAVYDYTGVIADKENN